MKIFIFYFSMILSSFLFAQNDKTIIAKPDIPLELKLLVQSYQTNDLSFTNLEKKIIKIDALGKEMAKEDFQFLIKEVIYKTILKSLPEQNEKYSIDSLLSLKKIGEKSKDAFFSWMIIAFYKDAYAMTSTPEYKLYETQKLSGNLTTPEVKKISKKIHLISKLKSFLPEDNPDAALPDFTKNYDRCLENIIETLYIMASESKLSKLKELHEQSNHLQFFDILQSRPPVKTPKKAEKTVEEIMDSKDNLPTAVNDPDWLKD